MNFKYREKRDMVLRSSDETYQSSMVLRSSMKTWIIRGTTTVLLWTCVFQLMATKEIWKPGLLPCFTRSDLPLVIQSSGLPPKVYLPPKRVYKNNGYLMVSWNGGLNQMRSAIFPLVKKYKVLHLNRTDAQLANNGLELEIQKLRCRVNFNALTFTSQIEELGRRVISILRKKGPFLVHLRYEMDMLAFSGCTHGCNEDEVDELTRMRYAYPWCKERVIDSERKTPNETSLTLRALGIDRNTQIYIAAGEIYSGDMKMAILASSFPNLVRKESLLKPSDLKFFQNHTSQMAALDYLCLFGK